MAALSLQTAERLATRMARNGDVEGIAKLVDRLKRDGVEPGFVQLISQYSEAAVRNIGRKAPTRTWYLQ